MLWQLPGDIRCNNIAGPAACAEAVGGEGEGNRIKYPEFPTRPASARDAADLNASRMPPPLFLLEDIYEIGRDFRYIGVGEIGI